MENQNIKNLKPGIFSKLPKAPNKWVNIAIIVSLVIVALLVVVGIFFRFLTGTAGPPAGDEERLEALRSDPMYSISYPNATELRRTERGSRGFVGGVEDPPQVTYLSGTNDENDDAILQFFIGKATENGWEIFRGPGKLSSAARLTVILHKDDIGSLFVALYEPERLNRLLLGEKLPENEYMTFIYFTLQAEHADPPWPLK